MAATALKSPSLPPGFKLDNIENDELPDLPRGFKLDKPSTESAEKGAARAAYQPIGGLLEATNLGLIGGILSAAGTGEALAELPELQERLPRLKELFPNLPWPEEIDEEAYLKATETASKYSPYTVHGIEQIVEDLTGAPLRPKTKGQEKIRLATTAGKLRPGGIIAKGASAAAAVGVESALEKAGVPENIASPLALLISQLGRSKGKGKAEAKLEGKVKPEVPPGEPPPGGKPSVPLSRPGGEVPPPVEVERFPSGLTKMKVHEGEVPKLATISKERQKFAINKLNEEAAGLTKKAVEKNLPISKQMEAGFDFEKAFEKGFSELEGAAQKYNPHINTGPLQKYIREAKEKFKDLVDLTAEDKSILKSIRNYQSKRPTELATLLKNYRKNNRHIGKLIENARITGSQRELVNYLENINREIVNSVRGTLPSDSAWMKSFDNLNKVYGGYKRTQKAQEILGPLLKGEATPAKIKSIAENPKVQKKLELALGKEGAKEVIQIAKDLMNARKQLAKIPVRDLNAMDAIYPLRSIFGFEIPGLSHLIRLAKVGRTGIGHYLTTPALRKNFDEAVKAAARGDVEAYKKATEILSKEPKQIEYKSK